jgi:acetyltransferase-like isoleucine patch superfamily enzyme
MGDWVNPGATAALLHIGDDVRIGTRAFVMSGISTRRGACRHPIRRHADAPAATVVAGNPARIVKQLSDAVHPVGQDGLP